MYDNRVSAIFLDLPVHVADPLEHLGAVHEQMDRLKQSHEPEAGEALTHLAAAVPPRFTARATHLAARLIAHVPQRTMNTVTTNVPGPQFPLYAAGREMLEYLPFVPLGPGVRVALRSLPTTVTFASGSRGTTTRRPTSTSLPAASTPR